MNVSDDGTYFCVSIPLRYADNAQDSYIAYVLDQFQFLLGTLITLSNALLTPAHSCFNSS